MEPPQSPLTVPSGTPASSPPVEEVRPPARGPRGIGLGRRQSTKKLSVMGNLQVLDAFSRNDRNAGVFKKEPDKIIVEKTPDAPRHDSSKSPPRRASDSAAVTPSLSGNLLGLMENRRKNEWVDKTDKREKKHESTGWISQMNRVMGNLNAEGTVRNGGTGRVKTGQSLNSSSPQLQNVIMDTSSGIGRSSSSGKFILSQAATSTTKCLNLKSLGEFESIEFADRLFELYIFYKKDANEALSIWSVEYPPMMKLIGKYKWTRSMFETLLRNKFAMDWYKMSVPSFNSSAEKSAAKKGILPISGRSGGFSGRGSKPRSSKLAHTAEAMEKSTEVFKRARDKSLQMHGAKMAGSLLRACMFHNSIPSAVDEWILQSKKLTELDELPFFRPFIETLLYHVQGSSTTLKIRLGMGVIFTYVDQLTDFWVMKTYFENENTRSNFYAMLLIFVFHLLQDLFWIRMWKRQNPESMKRDIWLRIFMIKPIYDLYKIFMDYPTDHGCLVDPLQEFVDTKQTEVIYECVPQSIIQGLALFKPNLENRKSQVISLAITVVSTGFNQAVSSIITDTDPRKRKKNKSSGYVGNSSFARTSAFCMLTVFTSIYNLLRVASYLLLINALGLTSVLVVLVEYILSLVALYLIKGDFYCWWPVSGKFSVVLALMVRLQVFFVTNFAPYTEHRLPWDSGGFFWMMSIMWALCSNFLYVLLGFLVKGDSICSPFKEETDNVGDDKICLETLSKEGTLGWLAGTTVVCLLFLFLFFLTIKRDQWKTYFENESSRNYNIRTGWHNEDDGQKVESLLKHSSLTPPVEEVREWMESNWVEWENENPSWFHHYRQTMIFVLKEEFLPSPGTLAKGESIKLAREIREEDEYLEEQRRLDESDSGRHEDEEEAEKNKTWAAGVKNGLRRASLLGQSGANTFAVGGRRGTITGSGTDSLRKSKERKSSTFNSKRERSRSERGQSTNTTSLGMKLHSQRKDNDANGMKLESFREDKDDSSGEQKSNRSQSPSSQSPSSQSPGSPNRALSPEEKVANFMKGHAS
ncbi:hypothetical protein TrST_g3611 [Triparma strigata]|uniref:Uncharacterized protein n=1 Tax=Triparma strigata TaxID=1606541 RepID=A0A9W7BDE2_9STRA|nr:hypothetical protein TrST_g3611 [Triparma strigata]